MEKTNSITFASLVVSLSGAPTWGIVSSYMLHSVKNITVLSMLIGFVLGLIVIKVYLKYFDKYHDKNIAMRNKESFGKLSFIINIIFILATFLLYIFFTYRLTSFLSTQYLIETKKIFMQLLLVFTTCYMSYKGTETLGRVSLLTLFISIGLFIFDISSLIHYVQIDNFLPIYDANIKDIIITSLYFTVFFSMPTIYVTSIKKDQIVDKDKFNKTFYLYYFLSFIPLLLAIITTLGIFGNNLIEMFTYPLYSVLKRIKLFSFIESIENVSMILWMIYIVNSSAIMLHSTVSSIKDTFNIKKSKYIYIILFLLGVLIPRIFLMNTNFVETYSYLKIPLILLLIIFLFTLIGLLIRNKQRKSASD